MTTDPFDLQRFLDAQAPVYPAVLGELRAGRKRNRMPVVLDEADWAKWLGEEQRRSAGRMTSGLTPTRAYTEGWVV